MGRPAAENAGVPNTVPTALYVEPDDDMLAQILMRPAGSSEEISSVVKAIIERVRQQGEEALRYYAEKYDSAELDQLFLHAQQINSCASRIDDSLRSAVQTAFRNISAFHRNQSESHREEPVETSPGIVCWRERRPIERVGIYVPGGTAPLFSTVLMLGIPARIAGCAEVILATPPNAAGEVHPAVAYAAQLCGIDRILLAGGAQAVAAMAYGTEHLVKVDKIFGPGNRYVTAAKQIVSTDSTAIDMPAGPSEVMIAADGSADPRFIAADMLSQAEHGNDSQAIAVVDTEEQAQDVIAALRKQLSRLSRREYAENSLKNSAVICAETAERKLAVINAYAPEHLIIQMRHPEIITRNLKHAGSVFIGPWSPESAGDYVSGTNHTLPTGGWARSSSGIGVESFQKIISFQQLSRAGLCEAAKAITVMAEAEGLEAHAEAVRIRTQDGD